ncbi:hypothetical protein OJF2_50160 [Aquisphaera giovannonii]|uniref:Cytochrome c domain-containing protein n=1 Tax=Aquisphaera giovannonii TaxID=406548 RepID=A0A5B9W705_9BACT|nr:hypothetical protein [Aquisphaera giovannonii]QEH36452.1 hypothetical protein OJF2_50160 [Aquisphaera giovannonii]
MPCPVVYARQPAGRGGPGDGAQLVRLDPDGTRRVLTAGFHSAGEPDVSIDGRRILFAGKHDAVDGWEIFEMDADGGHVRRVTRNLGPCRSPVYTSSYYTITEKEPWDQIAFVRPAGDRRDERTGGPATAIWTCKLDGSYVQRITYNLASDLDPAILPDGRLAYASWHRADLGDGRAGRLALESLNTDGSDRASIAPRSGAARRGPCVTPGGDLVFVESVRETGRGEGSLARVSLRRPLHTYERLTGPDDGLFSSPSPLPDGTLLVAWRGADATVRGICRLDGGARTLAPVCEETGFDLSWPRAVHPRPRPDGRSSVVSPDDREAEIYCLDVSIHDLPDPSWMPAGAVKSIRIVEGMPTGGAEPGSRREASAMSPVAELSPRRILAEIPVQADGSFHAKVPANVPIQLQALDGRGLAIRSCGWIWSRSHQAQGCIGCHEDPERTPPNRVPEALRTDVANATVPDPACPTPDFARDIVPIVESRCLPCHGAGNQTPELPAAGARDPAALDRLHAGLLGAAGPGERAIWCGTYIHPGRARTSPLAWHVVGARTARPWDEAEGSRGFKPIPVGRAPELTDAEIGTIIRWIDLGARRGAIPEARRQAQSGSNP